MAFADASIWLAMVNIIALFDIRGTVDEVGNEITPDPGFPPGLTRLVPQLRGAARITRLIPFVLHAANLVRFRVASLRGRRGPPPSLEKWSKLASTLHGG